MSADALEKSLVEAGVAGDAVVVQRLLAAGADPTTALWETAFAGHVTALQVLLEASADPNIVVNGHTPLTIAAQNGWPEVLRELLADVDLGLGADVDAVDEKFGGTALHWACQRNDVECVQVLMQNGCDTSIEDKSGYTAYQMAELNNCDAAIEQLGMSGFQYPDSVLKVDAEGRESTHLSFASIGPNGERGGYMQIDCERIFKVMNMSPDELAAEMKEIQQEEDMEEQAAPANQMDVKETARAQKNRRKQVRKTPRWPRSWANSSLL
jgi:hypothetical protein